MKYMLIAVPLMALVLITGCGGQRHPTYVGVPIPLTQHDIIEMTRAGATDEDIIREIAETNSVFHLTTNDIDNLKNAGVSDAVINDMLDTPNRRVYVVERVRVVPSYYPFYDPWYDPWYDPYYYPRSRVRVHMGFHFHRFR